MYVDCGRFAALSSRKTITVYTANAVGTKQDRAFTPYFGGVVLASLVG